MSRFSTSFRCSIPSVISPQGPVTLTTTRPMISYSAPSVRSLIRTPTTELRFLRISTTEAVIGHLRPVVGGRRHEVQHVALRAAHLAVVVDGPRVEPVGVDARQELLDLAFRYDAVVLDALVLVLEVFLVVGKQVVDRERRLKREAALHPVAVERDDKGDRVDEVRRDYLHDPPLRERLAHEPQLEVLEVPQPPVDQLAGRGAGGVGKIVLFEHRHGKPAQARVPGHRRAGDAAADDDQVVVTLAHLFDVSYHGRLA